MAALVDEKLLQQLEAAQFYSLLVDESTDIATDCTLITYVWFVKSGEVNMRFFELTELHGGNAEAILDTILRTLEQKRLPIEKAYGIATDGASVMIGVRKGVTTRRRRGTHSCYPPTALHTAWHLQVGRQQIRCRT